MMNMRLARPGQVIDLNRISELSYLEVDNGQLRIGAMTRQRAVERSTTVAKDWPLLSEATRYIGHVQIRNRGTIGGSLGSRFSIGGITGRDDCTGHVVGVTQLSGRTNYTSIGIFR